SGFSGFFSLKRLLFPALFGPTFLYSLAAAAEGQRVCGNVIGNGGTGSDVGPLIDSDGRYQCGITADEGSIFNDGYVFGHAIVVAGDGAGAHVYVRANFCVAQIGEVISLGASTQSGLL